MDIDYASIKSVTRIDAGLYNDYSPGGKKCIFSMQYTRKEGNEQHFSTITSQKEVLAALQELKRREMISPDEFERVQEEAKSQSRSIDALIL